MPARSSRPSGTTSTTSVDPVPEIADAAAAAGAWLHVDAAYAGSARVCPELRTPGLRARRLARRQPAQVAVHPGRLLVPLHGAARRPARGLRAHARVPAHLRRGRHEPQRVRPRARPALPRAQAVGRAALLRPGGAAGDDPRARAPRGAVRGLGARRARLGALRAAPLLGRVLPAGGRGRAQRGADGGRQRERRGVPLAHAARRPARPAPRGRQRLDDRGRRAPDLGRPAARGRAPRRGACGV